MATAADANDEGAPGDEATAEEAVDDGDEESVGEALGRLHDAQHGEWLFVEVTDVTWELPGEDDEEDDESTSVTDDDAPSLPDGEGDELDDDDEDEDAQIRIHIDVPGEADMSCRWDVRPLEEGTFLYELLADHDLEPHEIEELIGQKTAVRWKDGGWKSYDPTNPTHPSYPFDDWTEECIETPGEILSESRENTYGEWVACEVINVEFDRTGNDIHFHVHVPGHGTKIWSWNAIPFTENSGLVNILEHKGLTPSEIGKMEGRRVLVKPSGDSDGAWVIHDPANPDDGVEERWYDEHPYTPFEHDPEDDEQSPGLLSRFLSAITP